MEQEGSRGCQQDREEVNKVQARVGYYTCSQKHILIKQICPEVGPMKNRPDIGLHPGTMLIEIDYDGFLGILSKKWI